MAAEKLELSLMVTECSLKTDHSSDTSVFWKLQFVTINEKGEVRNPSSSFGSEPFGGFDNLVFRCYISWQHGFSADCWKMLYDRTYSTTLRDAELMVKTFKRIAKITAGLVVRPKTFGQYVALMSAGLGIKRYTQVEGRENGWHPENRHSFHAVSDLADRIDYLIEKARKAKFDVQEVA